MLLGSMYDPAVVLFLLIAGCIAARIVWLARQVASGRSTWRSWVTLAIIAAPIVIPLLLGVLNGGFK